MEKKNELTIEELRREYEEAKNQANALGEQLKKAQQEEKDRKRAELARTQKARRKEIDDVWAKYIELSKAYERDYGVYILPKKYIDDFPWHLLWN